MRWIRSLNRSRFPLLTLGSLMILLIAGVGIGVFDQRALKDQLARQAEAQADLLASAVSGALAFNDRDAAQEYVDAVQVNPNVIAAAVYDADNQVVASFARGGESIPPVAIPRDRFTVFQDGRLYVVRPVVQAGQRLGTARLRLLDTPPTQRFSRDASLLLVLGLAALAVTILAVAQSALKRANQELARKAQDLAESNSQLQKQMAEREKAEEALRQSQKMEAVGRLTGGIAHDFNNLLMVASSGIELMDRTEDVERRALLREGVRQAIDRGAALTQQLLAFSRRSPLKAAVLDPTTHIEGLRFLLERSLREDIEVELDLPSNAWMIEVDPGELELSLMNLAVNARDAMPNGGSLKVSVANVQGEAEGEDCVLIKVADTGIGMPEAIAQRIFEPFFTTKEVGRGTGLGLSQVYGFARSSGGEVTVDSREGVGTTFTLCLPRSRKASSIFNDAEPELPGAPGSIKRLLLVEDDDAVAASVGYLLRDLGHSYVRAARAADALRILESRGPFDMVISDMLMPGEMDGLALAKEIRKRQPDLPILLTTGFSEAASTVADENFKLMLKPFGISDLAKALAAA
mgnify:CR=1 FL=1